MKSSETITASSRRVVTIALRKAAEIGHRNDLSSDSEATALVREAYDHLQSKAVRISSRNPLFHKSRVIDEDGAAEKHLSNLVRMIHLKDREALLRIVSVSLVEEISEQLKPSRCSETSETVVQLIRAMA